MFKFADNIEEDMKEILRSEKVSVTKSNPQSKNCWNDHHCEVQISDEYGGHLVIKVDIYDQFGSTIEGEVSETWYWDEDLNPEPVILLFSDIDKKVELAFDNGSNEGFMTSQYGGNVIM